MSGIEKKQKPKKKIEPLESAIQIQIVDYCRKCLDKKVLFWHTPNGELREKRIGDKLKAMGVLAGVPDLIFMWATFTTPQVFFVEVKRNAKEKLNEAQLALIPRLPFDTFIVTSLDEFRAIAHRYGISREAKTLPPENLNLRKAG